MEKTSMEKEVKSKSRVPKNFNLNSFAVYKQNLLLVCLRKVKAKFIQEERDYVFTHNVIPVYSDYYSLSSDSRLYLFIIINTFYATGLFLKPWKPLVFYILGGTERDQKDKIG